MRQWRASYIPQGSALARAGPLLASEWEDVLEADSVRLEKTLKATREHEMQNNGGLLFWTCSHYSPILRQGAS